VFRTWDDEDDAVSTERERVALLELSATAANLQEVQQMVSERIEASQEMLDHIEQDLETAADQTAQAVACLSDATDVRLKRLQWLAPSLCLLVTGSAALAGAPAACVSCLAFRGAFVAGATATTGLGTAKLAKWQHRALQSIKDQLPAALTAMPLCRKAMLKVAGEEVERRLVSKLGDIASWKPVHFSLTGRWTGLPVWERQSDVREGGVSCSTSFKVDLPASHVFRILRRLSLSGSLDPGCDFCWSCPVDPTDGVWLRYLVFSNWFANRAFHCVCRCARIAQPPQPPQRNAGEAIQDVEGDHAAAPTAPVEKYVFGVTSLSPEMLGLLELPGPGSSVPRGSFHVCGVVVTALDSQASRVEVMADVDLAMSVSPTSLVDRDVRLHVLQTADRIAAEARRETSAAHGPSPVSGRRTEPSPQPGGSSPRSSSA